jgi:ATP-dependent protease ClpP protease subunit
MGVTILAATLSAALLQAPPADDRLLAAATAGYEQCRTRLKGASSDGPGQAVLAGPAVICFAGRITRESMDRLLEVFAQVPKTMPITFAAVSNGGSAAAALDIAEQIVAREVTFVAGPVCASSCANYFFLPADRRIVLKDSLVIFHGGMSPGYLKKVEKELAAARKKRPADQAKIAGLADVVAKARESMPRQEAMLRAVNANPKFFEMFDYFSVLPGSKFRKDCSTSLKAREFVLSDRLLRANGIEVHVNQGPRTSADLDVIINRRGDGGKLCLWS